MRSNQNGGPRNIAINILTENPDLCNEIAALVREKLIPVIMEDSQAEGAAAKKEGAKPAEKVAKTAAAKT